VTTSEPGMPDESSGHQDEMKEAQEIQLGLLPREIPQLHGYEIAAWLPARVVSGDSFDLMTFPGSTLGLSIADVSGKGMPAALLASNLHALVRATAETISSPSKLCEKVNREISRRVASGRFISFFYGLLDGVSQRFTYTNAGHNPPILLRRDSSILRPEEGGMLLGISRNSNYRQGEIHLNDGDRLLLYTDGVTDALDPGGKEFSEARLVQFLKENGQLGAGKLQEKLAETIAAFGAGNLMDDITMIVVAVDSACESAPRTMSVGAMR